MHNDVPKFGHSGRPTPAALSGCMLAPAAAQLELWTSAMRTTNGLTLVR